MMRRTLWTSETTPTQNTTTKTTSPPKQRQRTAIPWAGTMPCGLRRVVGVPVNKIFFNVFLPPGAG